MTICHTQYVKLQTVWVHVVLHIIFRCIQRKGSNNRKVWQLKTFSALLVPLTQGLTRNGCGYS